MFALRAHTSALSYLGVFVNGLSRNPLPEISPELMICAQKAWHYFTNTAYALGSPPLPLAMKRKYDDPEERRREGGGRTDRSA
jgi:hypothetical protein